MMHVPLARGTMNACNILKVSKEQDKGNFLELKSLRSELIHLEPAYRELLIVFCFRPTFLAKNIINNKRIITKFAW